MHCQLKCLLYFLAYIHEHDFYSTNSPINIEYKGHHADQYYIEKKNSMNKKHLVSLGSLKKRDEKVNEDAHSKK